VRKSERESEIVRESESENESENFNSKERLLSLDMKTKVVQHVERE
jgi:hypothetical protein